jgi:hypothetical protein
MYNIRNIYLDNVGFKDAWFSNLHIPLYEHHSKKVSNTVLSLTNGGGKTTILSLIFSCFVPEQRNFIQHLQKPGHHFKDYFEKSPGLILIELEKLAEKESNLFDEKLIIGQYVYINSSDNEPVRYFFSFKPDSFSYEEIPSNGRSTLKSKKDLRNWFNDASKKYSNFFYTTKQQEWKNWLDSNNVDTWLAEKQVGFCRSEGGIDKFMSFKSERDFLKEFFYMSLSAEDSNDVRSVLSLSLKKLKRRPLFEKQSLLLNELKIKLSNFSEDASKYLNSSQINNISLKDSKSLYHSFSCDLKKIKENINIEQSKLNNYSNQAKETEKSFDNNQKQNDSLNSLLLKKRFDKNTEKLQKTEFDKEKYLKDERNCKAAVIYKKVDLIENEISSLNSSIEDNLPVNESRKNNNICASKLKTKLEINISESFREKENHNKIIKSLKDKNVGIETEISVLNEESSVCSEDIAVLKSFNELKDLSSQKLVESGILNEKDPEKSLETIETTINNIEEQLRTNKNTIEEYKTSLDNSKIRLEDINQTKVNDESKIEKLLNIIDGAEKEKKEICENRIFLQLLGSNDFEPDSVEIKGLLDSYIERVKLNSNKFLIEKEKLSDKLSKINRSNSSLVSKNTIDGLTFLKDNEINSARLFTEYLSDHYKEDLKSFKYHLESNPGRYTGICVNNEDFEKVKKLLDRCELKRPVIVSLCELGIEDNPFITLFGNDLKALSRKETKIVENKIEKKIKKTDENYDKINSELSDLYLLKVKLKNYIINYSDGKLTKHISDLALINESIESKNNSINVLINERDDLEKKVNTVSSGIIILNDDLNKFKYDRKTLDTFIMEFHNFSSENLTKADELSEKINNHKEKTEQLKSEFKNNLLLIDQSNIDINTISNKIQSLKDENSLINCDNTSTDKENIKDISTEQLRSEYSLSLKSLKNKLSDNNFENLNILIESKNEQLNALLEEIKRYTDIDDEYVRKISKLDSNEIIQMEDKLREKIDNLLDVKGSLTITVRELKAKIKLFEKGINKNDLDHSFNSFDIKQLEDLLEKNIEEKMTIIKSKEKLKEQISDIYRKINGFQKLDRETTLLQKNIRLDEDRNMENIEEVQLPDSVEKRENLVDSLNKQYLNSLNELNNKRDNAISTYNNLIEFSKNEKFISIEPDLSAEISRGNFELTINSVDNQLNKIDERIESVDAVIDESQKDLDLCVNKLMNHVTMAFSKLKRAVKISKLPDSLNKIGGKQVLKLSTDINSIPLSVRKNELENYVKSLTEKDNIPGVGTINGDELTADAVGSIIRSKNQKGTIGIKIIKLSRNITYTPVENITGSGGESMTSALLLYLVMAQLRAESKGGSKDSAGGFLLMDNPFAKATKPEFVKAQVELANSLGFQLIYATGIKDLNAISQFAHIVQLRPFSINKTNEKVKIQKVTIESSEITTLN